MYASHVLALQQLLTARLGREVRLPFLFVTWLVLGCLVTTEDVAALLVYQYVMGAERLGLGYMGQIWSRCDLNNLIFTEQTM